MIKKYLSIIMCLCLAAVPIMAFASDDIITVDFEDCELGVIADTAGNHTWKDFSFTLSDGDKVEIADDNGNKALKITKGSQNSDLLITYDFEKISSGVADISFDIKAAHHSKWFGNLGTLLTESGSEVGKILTYGSDLYTAIQLSGTTVIQYRTLSNESRYANICHRMDFESSSHTYKPYYYDASGNKKSGTKEGSTSASNVKKIFLSLRNVYLATATWNGGAKATEDNPDNNGIYYIDNIKIQKYILKVNSINIPQTDASIEPSGKITFNTSILKSSFNDQTVKLTSGETEVALNSAASGKEITFSPVEALEYNAEYTLTVLNTLKANGYGPMTENYVYTFKTESVIPEYSDLKSGERYTKGFIPELPEKEGITYAYEANGEPYQKGDAFNDIESVSLKITATNPTNGRSQTKTIDFEILGEVSPEAENVKITGEGKIENTLTGSYDFIDLNGDKEGESVYKWYRSETKDGAYSQIENANGLSYKLTSDDEDCYIKFGVTPVSQKDPNDYKEYLSEAFMSEFNPTATDIKISGTAVTGNTLSASYTYGDLNCDEEAGSLFSWYRGKTEDGVYKKIENATEKTYTLTADDEDCYIKFGVAPKNNGTGSQDKEFLSEPLKGAFKPVVTDVKVTGTLKSGNSVGASYSYYDENGDEKENCIIEWYIGGSLKATGESYKITSADSGKSLYISVTPVAKNEPKQGEAVKSQTYKIASSSNGSSYTGSSSGGSFTTNKKNDNVNTETNKKDDVGNDEKIIFSDIENHWAKEIILSMYEKGIINGKGEKLFMPDGEITRAEFASIIARLYNLETGENAFNDVSDDDWFKDAVTAVYKAGYMSGDNGCFRPNDKITREEICVVIKNILKLEASDAENFFTDASEISDWARGAVYATQELGIVKGDNGFFKPKSSATRAEATVMLERMTETEVK